PITAKPINLNPIPGTPRTMDNKRLFLTISLAFILVLIWQAWDQQHPSAPVSAPATTSAPAQPRSGDVPSVPESARSEPTKTPTAPAAAGFTHGERIEVVTDMVKAGIDTQGGDLRDLRLRHYP